MFNYCLFALVWISPPRASVWGGGLGYQEVEKLMQKVKKTGGKKVITGSLPLISCLCLRTAVKIRNFKWYHDNFSCSSNQWCFTDSFAMIPCYGSSCESGTFHGARSMPPAEPGQWPGRQWGMPVPAACAALTKQQGTVKNPLVQTL